MGQSFDADFSALASIREELAVLSAAGDTASEAASGLFVRIDLLARTILFTAVGSVWHVPATESRKGGMPLLVRLANAYAPPTVDRGLLNRLVYEHHGIRNAIEHDKHQVSPQRCIDYLESVEMLIFSIAEPGTTSRPVPVFRSLAGAEVVGAHEIVRGVAGHPWYVFHGRLEQSYGAKHALEFWRFDGDDWRLERELTFGDANIATVQRIETRSVVQQEILIWRRVGESMGSMSYDVLAVEGDRIVRLLSRSNVPGAYVVQRGQTLEEHAGDRTIRYTWDGSAYAACLVVRHTPADVDTVDIHYSVEAGVVRGPTSVRLKRGQGLRLLRDDFEPTIVRQLHSANDVLASNAEIRYSGATYGRTEITLIPDVYDWNHALRIDVWVTDDAEADSADDAMS